MSGAGARSRKRHGGFHGGFAKSGSSANDPFAAALLEPIPAGMVKRLWTLPPFIALAATLHGCSSKGDVVIPAGELLSVRIGEETFQIPFEYQPYVSEMVAEELYKQKLSGIGTQAVPAVARDVTFSVVDNKTGEQDALSVTILELNNPSIATMQQASIVE